MTFRPRQPHHPPRPMDPPTAKTYENMEVIDGDQGIWVSQLDSYESGVERAEADRALERYGLYFILMGPTGSGKSSFIEAIASKSSRKPLGIAKDQLESVTQEPCIYEIKNLRRYGQNIYLIDTPGLADPRISELQVLNKVRYWHDMGHSSIGGVRILYFHPITDIRMPASRKRCLDIVQNFWGIRECSSVMLVISMWDRLSERSIATAEKRFAELSTSYWGDWVEEGSPAVTDTPLRDEEYGRTT